MATSFESLPAELPATGTALDEHAPIALTPIQSSQIAAIGYDPEASALSVLFKNRDGSAGSLYQYDSVSADVHAALVGAESVGSFFIHNIKRQAESYPCRKIDAARGVVAHNDEPVLARVGGGS